LGLSALAPVPISAAEVLIPAKAPLVDSVSVQAGARKSVLIRVQARALAPKPRARVLTLALLARVQGQPSQARAQVSVVVHLPVQFSALAQISALVRVPVHALRVVSALVLAAEVSVARVLAAVPVL